MKWSLDYLRDSFYYDDKGKVVGFTHWYSTDECCWRAFDSTTGLAIGMYIDRDSAKVAIEEHFK